MPQSTNEVFSLEIETRILDFDPQPGMKSRQFIVVERSPHTRQFRAKSSYTTGKTRMLGRDISSVRDDFKVTPLLFRDMGAGGKKLSFKAVGQTASGVGFMPNIDYSFDFSISTVNGKSTVKLTGEHDGYPAYTVWLHTGTTKKELYKFKHKSMNLHKLFGKKDTKANKTTTMDALF